MMAYSKVVGYDNANATRPITYAAQQINYILGDCGRSWVVGFGKDSPIRPYHKSSYNSFIDYLLRGKDNGVQGEDFLHSTTVNRFILYGRACTTFGVIQIVTFCCRCSGGWPGLG
jgi:endoglucanase